MDVITQLAKEIVIGLHRLHDHSPHLGTVHVCIGQTLHLDGRIVVFQVGIKAVHQSVQPVHMCTSAAIAHLHQCSTTGDLLRLLALHDYGEAVF